MKIDFSRPSVPVIYDNRERTHAHANTHTHTLTHIQTHTHTHTHTYTDRVHACICDWQFGFVLGLLREVQEATLNPIHHSDHQREKQRESLNSNLYSD